MKTREPKSKASRNTDSNAALLRLERYNKDLASLKNKLGSYVCEPKTLNLFERMESLKSRLDNMRRSNQEIINALNERTLFFEDVSERIKKQIEAYKALELSVLEYIGMAKMHC